MDKGAVLGAGVLLVYRLVLLVVIAFFVLGVSSMIYRYEINVRDAEAKIISRKVSNCLAVKSDEVKSLYLQGKDSLFRSCDLLVDETRYLFSVNVSLLDGSRDYLFYSGDMGSRWVRQMSEDFEGYQRYSPGYSREFYDLEVAGSPARAEVEVFVNADV